MERERFIYLIGLVPIAVTSVLLLIWLATGLPLLTWLGLLGSLLALLAVIYGFFQGYGFYNDKSVPERERQARKRHFIGHTVVLSLALAFSFQGFRVFRSNLAIPGQASGLEILIKNTSDQPAKDLQIQAGTFNERIAEIPARGERSLHINLAVETVLTARLGAGSEKPAASVQVGPSDQALLLRLDFQQNIMPEVQ